MLITEEKTILNIQSNWKENKKKRKTMLSQFIATGKN